MRSWVTSERANSIECYKHIWLKMFYEYGPSKIELHNDVVRGNPQVIETNS